MTFDSLKTAINSYRSAPTATPAGLQLIDVFLQVLETQERRIRDLEKRLPGFGTGGSIGGIR
jgi:hypothetical protein